MSWRYPPFFPPLMQWAAVISRSRPGLATTLAVQKWSPLASCSNSAPTRRLSRAGCAVSGWPSRYPGSRHGVAASSLVRFQKPAGSLAAACGWLAAGAGEQPPAAATATIMAASVRSCMQALMDCLANPRQASAVRT